MRSITAREFVFGLTKVWPLPSFTAYLVLFGLPAGAIAAFVHGSVLWGVVLLVLLVAYLYVLLQVLVRLYIIASVAGTFVAGMLGALFR